MNKAIFLDRDGVINEVLSNRVKFVNQPKDFYLLEGVGEAIRHFNDARYKVFVVTNQGGIGLGYMSENSLKDVHDKMKEELMRSHAFVDDITYCPHVPQAGCACRKPKPKMIFQLAKKHHVDLNNSYMVGDREPDIMAGQEAGTKTVLVGKRKANINIKADLCFLNLLSFSMWLKN